MLGQNLPINGLVMNFIRVFVYLFLFSVFYACNTAEQKPIEGSSTTSSSVKSATFIYNVSKIILTENTTSAHFVPVEKFEGSFYRVLPTLPAGLALNTSTGEISGTPTETLTETEFLVEVETISSTEYAFLNITVNPEPPKSLSYPFSTLTFNKGQVGAYTPTTSGGTIETFTESPILPFGLVLNKTTGAIETDPTVSIAALETLMIPGSSFHTITAANSSGSISTTVLININDAPPVGLSYAPITQEFVIGASSGFTTMVPSLSATDPTPTTVQYSIFPALPNGLELLADGSIAGTPEEVPGISTYTVTAKNAVGSTSSVITLSITKPVISFSYNPNTYSVEENVAITPILISTYVGGAAPSYRCFIDADVDNIEDPGEVGTCPAWVTLDAATGVISGTPTALGITTITVLAENSDNSSPLADTPANPPVAKITFNITEDGPADPNDIGYESIYTISENQILTITPLNKGGKPSQYNLLSGTLEVGTGNNLTISSATNPSIATFATGLSSSVGPGQAINYDSDNDGAIDSVAHIMTRIDANNFEVVLANGNQVSAMATADQDWFINNALPPGIGFINGVLTGKANFSQNGSSSCTAVNSTSVDYNLNIEGKNLDQTSTLVQTGTQNIIVRVLALAPTRLGYTEDRSGTIFKNGVFELTDGSPIPPADVIAPNGLSGGTPQRYAVTPRLPKGLVLDTCTGIISGTPQEILPIKNYTITATNATGSFSETIAISTNNLIKPTALVYNDADSSCTDNSATDNDLTFTIYSTSVEIPCYTGSAATFTISPALPSGLSINSQTGEISGMPLTTDDTIKNYTVTATNILGSLSTNITLDINNLTLIASDIKYYNSATQLGTLTKTEGDIILPGELSFQVASNSPQSGIPTSATATLTTAAPAPVVVDNFVSLASGTDPKVAATQTRNLVLNFSTGEFSTFVESGGSNLGLKPTDPGELYPSADLITVTLDNDATVAPGVDVTFNLLVKEKAINFDYPNSNTISFVPDKRAGALGADSTSGAAAHTGGAVATESNGVAANLCQATLLSSTNLPSGASLTDADLLNNAGTGVVLDPANCNISYDGSICASDVVVNTYNVGNTTLEYRIEAFNSGSPSGFSKNVRINYYDQPNFVYEPDTEFTEAKYTPSNGYILTTGEFEVSKNLTLQANSIGSTGAPTTTNRCHVGDFQLSLLSDLPSSLTFNATDGSITNTREAIVGRRNFELISTESVSGLSLTKSEDISVQANHQLANGGSATKILYAEKVDLNSDGLDDLIIRNHECDDKNGDGASDGACGAGVSTTLYMQNVGTAGLLENLSSPFPSFANINAVAIRPITYDANKSGIIYVSNTQTTVEAQSTTDYTDSGSVAVTTAKAGSGFVRGIVTNKKGISSAIGVVMDNGAGGISIDQYEVATDLTLTAFVGVTTKLPTINVETNANGGIDLGTGGIYLVTQNDTDGDGNMDAVIAYRDSVDGNSKVCVLKNDGNDFATTCNPRINIANNGDVIDIKFANIANDNLEEMFILANDGSSNTIYVYENQNSNVAGYYQNVDLVTLKTNSTFANFDLEDVNNDNYIDIIANDVYGDVDRDKITDSILSGLTVYYNSNLSSDYYSPAIADSFPTLLHYSKSAGDSNDIEILKFGTSQLIFHCQIDIENGSSTALLSTGSTVSSDQISSCGIIGSF